jgi:hypothetical protein
MNGKLYITTGYKIFEFDGKEFVFCTEHAYGLVFNFCDNVIVWHPKKSIGKLNPNLVEEELVVLDPTTDWLCCVTGGVAVFSNTDCKIVTLVNMVDMKTVKYETDNLDLS